MTLTKETIEAWRHTLCGPDSGTEELDEIFNLALIGLAVQPMPTHKHIKTGGLYQMLGSGSVQSDRPLTDMQAVVIYRAMADGTLWAREFHEFHDATHFIPLTSLPEPKI